MDPKVLLFFKKNFFPQDYQSCTNWCATEALELVTKYKA